MLGSDQRGDARRSELSTRAVGLHGSLARPAVRNPQRGSDSELRAWKQTVARDHNDPWTRSREYGVFMVLYSRRPLHIQDGNYAVCSWTSWIGTSTMTHHFRNVSAHCQYFLTAITNETLNRNRSQVVNTTSHGLEAYDQEVRGGR